MDEDYKILVRDDDELYELIEHEINKKFTFKKICKEIDNEEILNTDGNFKQNQCFYMCNKNISSIKKCKNNSIENIELKSRQVKKIKILKKTFVSDEELSVVTIASTKINDIENKIIIKDFYDEYEMMYELFISNLLKSDPIIEKHICGYFGRKSNTSKLLLEYIEGKTLMEMTNLSMKDFSDIISQIFLTLDYAYRKYGFLHGDLHTDNFLILHNPTDKFDIEIPLSNGKNIKYKSDYKVVFLDFGLSHLKHKFNSNGNVQKVLMIPLEQDILGYNYSIPLVDITKLLVFIMIEIVYENKHNKLTEVGVYISNFIQYLYSIIGISNKKINSSFFNKSRSDYGYIYDLINSNLDLSFEDLYIKFVNGTKMDIHKIIDYFDKDNKEDKINSLLKENIEETNVISKIIQQITNENINLTHKIEKIKDFIKDVNKMILSTKTSGNSKSILNKEQMKYISLNLYHYTCKYELNKILFIDDNDMISLVNKVYSKFVENNIIKSLKTIEKYKVIDNIIEFKINKYIDQFVKDIDINNIFNKYENLKNISNEQISNIKTEKMNKVLKSIFIKNYNKLPLKLFQQNFIDNEINIKKLNSVEQMKFLSEIVYQIKKQLHKLDIRHIKMSKDTSVKSQFHHLHLFFYNLYKYCEKTSLNLIEQAKYDFIDWISYNRIILYDYYIRHLSLYNLPDSFIKVYLEIIELEDEIWEKFYKKDDFQEMANTLLFSENMLNLIVNCCSSSNSENDISKLLILLNKIDSSENSIKSLKENINKMEKNKLKPSEINYVLNHFKKFYKS